MGLNKENAGDADTIDAKENNPYAYLNSNRLFTKYYSMDPVSQATKSLDKRNNANDWYFVDLTKDIIPMIESYTPKATYEHKNIFYNKTKLDTTKPNYITCTFGIQATALMLLDALTGYLLSIMTNSYGIRSKENQNGTK